mmetsp:Transcript_6338/g.8865  ORF Transcript_6338/g.8865 Transcript_6338/m.8865 type:complete len:366 (+) Transcript_6338:2-1099(+)
MDNKIKSIINRVDIIQPSVSVFHNDRRFTVAEISLINSQKIVQLFENISNCVSRAEAEQQLQSLLELRISCIKIQNQLDKSMSLMDQLSKAQVAINNRLNNHDLSISLKLDKTDVNNLDTALAKLDVYENFKQNTLTSLEERLKFENEIMTTVQGHSSKLSQISTTLLESEEEIDSKASKIQLISMLTDLREMNKLLNKCASSTALNEVDESLQQSLSLLASLSHQLTAVQSTLQSHSQQLVSKAASSDLLQCVSRQHFEQAVHALGDEVETKAAAKDAAALLTKLQEVEHRLQEESSKVQVAVRFVEWFTSRGAGYEHNLQAIDRHLQQLVPTALADPARQQLGHGVAMLRAQRDMNQPPPRDS